MCAFFSWGSLPSFIRFSEEPLPPEGEDWGSGCSATHSRPCCLHHPPTSRVEGITRAVRLLSNCSLITSGRIRGRLFHAHSTEFALRGFLRQAGRQWQRPRGRLLKGTQDCGLKIPGAIGVMAWKRLLISSFCLGAVGGCVL